MWFYFPKKKDVILAKTIANYYFKVGVLMSLDKTTNIFIPSTYWSLILTPMKFIFSIILKVLVHQMIIKMHYDPMMDFVNTNV
jgi:hypothetical protein